MGALASVTAMVWFEALFALRYAPAPWRGDDDSAAQLFSTPVKHFALDQDHRLVPPKLLRDPVFPPENRRTVSPLRSLTPAP